MSLVGCASVMNDVTHGVRIDTRTVAGEKIDGADCTASNDYGSTTIKSGSIQAVRRSSKELEIKCTHAGQPDATGRATSRANAGLAGNIIFGGVIGAVVDHNRGTAYTYPTWIEMTFGKSLVFDRAQEKEGTVLKGYVAGTQPPVPTVGTSSPTSHQCMSQLPGAICPK
jgi:hypothetical protein